MKDSQKVDENVFAFYQLMFSDIILYYVYILSPRVGCALILKVNKKNKRIDKQSSMSLFLPVDYVYILSPHVGLCFKSQVKVMTSS